MYTKLLLQITTIKQAVPDTVLVRQNGVAMTFVFGKAVVSQKEQKKLATLFFSFKLPRMRTSLFVSLFLFSIQLFAQTTYYSYDPNTGVSTKMGYSVPSNTTPYKTPYSGYNPNIYGNAIMEMQRRYDNNVAQIRENVKTTSKVINDLENYDEKGASILREALDDYLNTLRACLNFID